jgi:hypothetical protein
MPGSSTLQRGNLIFDLMIQATITPPATVTTATTNTTTTTIQGLNVGDLVSWNQLTNPNALLTVANMYVSAANTLTSVWTTEGATVSGAAACSFILEVCRAENYSLSGISSLPTTIT